MIENAKKAGVLHQIQVQQQEIARFVPQEERGIVICNPPYGERLGDLAGAAKLEAALGERLRAHPVRGAYIITADADFERNFGARARRRRKLYNGMIPCQVYMYF